MNSLEVLTVGNIFWPLLLIAIILIALFAKETSKKK
ncbi:MAG: hypothetical protein UV59_C0002G0024 [Candidatus Gottesmanbacteria bacterium GW2011_GWA1_43_11]|uniref:Uncharacterized protein n=1 Tax=Candidatus Gottesmanbacteria bacterium GW2011_GWA1_43_11 TaxID=1618436 RepID=A0A0G1CKX6_9BACT|nr:MAG: hypothetical protein UV59_C0002G0024 [Candidatus Gottesmanbacteria bacterium GW2011_GWA1_43_11]